MLTSKQTRCYYQTKTASECSSPRRTKNRNIPTTESSADNSDRVTLKTNIASDVVDVDSELVDNASSFRIVGWEDLVATLHLGGALVSRGDHGESSGDKEDKGCELHCWESEDWDL